MSYVSLSFEYMHLNALSCILMFKVQSQSRSSLQTLHM